jgi:hypothetical protein
LLFQQHKCFGRDVDMQEIFICLSTTEVRMRLRNVSSYSENLFLKRIFIQEPHQKEVHHHYNKVSFLRSCQVTVHIQINEPLNAVCNSNSWHLSDNAELPSPPQSENRQQLSRIFIYLKSAECPLKGSKMCIRPHWQMPKVQSLK